MSLDVRRRSKGYRICWGGSDGCCGLGDEEVAVARVMEVPYLQVRGSAGNGRAASHNKKNLHRRRHVNSSPSPLIAILQGLEDSRCCVDQWVMSRHHL